MTRVTDDSFRSAVETLRAAMLPHVLVKDILTAMKTGGCKNQNSIITAHSQRKNAHSHETPTM